MAKKSERDPNRPVFIFDTPGDWCATKFGDAIYNTRGDYVGWLEGEDIYKLDGEWVGRLSKDGRILRKRTERRRELHPHPRTTPPPKPERMPARAPLPPMMADLNYSIVDVLDEEPDIFKQISDLKPDMD